MACTGLSELPVTGHNRPDDVIFSVFSLVYRPTHIRETLIISAFPNRWRLFIGYIYYTSDSTGL